jgi:hypothetical protein
MAEEEARASRAVLSERVVNDMMCVWVLFGGGECQRETCGVLCKSVVSLVLWDAENQYILYGMKV